MQLAIIDRRRWTMKLDAAEKAQRKQHIDTMTEQVFNRATEHVLEVDRMPTRAQVRKIVAKLYGKAVKGNVQNMVDAELAARAVA